MESGRLEDESTASLCRRVAEESRTGCLHLEQEGDAHHHDVRIYLQAGRLHTARSATGGGRLGDRLVGGGHLTQDQLEMALTVRQDESEQVRLGHVLIRSGLVAREVLRAVLREQVLDTISVPLGWTAGTWRFVDGETTVEENPLGMGMQDALMEGARRLGQLELIKAHMGSMDTIVDFPSTGRSSKLSLKPDEWAMLTHIDGRTTVAEIADLAGYSELEAARIIYGLLSAGVVRTVEDLAAPTAAPTGASPSAAAPAAAPTVAPDAAPAPARADALAELEAIGQRGPARGVAERDATHLPEAPQRDEDDRRSGSPPSGPSWSTPRPAPEDQPAGDRKGFLGRRRRR